MRTWTKSIVALMAVALMGSWSAMPVKAADGADSAATGSIKGTVVKAGSPVANMVVRLVKTADMPAGGGQKKLAADDKKPGAEKEKPKGERPKPVAEATTDDKGAFTMENVPAGEYTLVAGDRTSGMGRSKVTVTGGGTATVSVEIKERKAKPQT